MEKQLDYNNYLVDNKYLIEEPIINYDKFNENNFSDAIVFDIPLPENLDTGVTEIHLSKPFIYENKSVDGDKDIISKKNITFRGRKRKNSGKKGVHNKYSQDNILRRIKCNVLLNLLNYINDKIVKIYKNKIGKGIFEKQLKKLGQKNIMSSKLVKNIEFLHKNLKDIFSENISSRYSYYNYDHNKRLIEVLLNEKNLEIRNYFEKLFSLTFLECLFHFRGDKYFEELEGIESLDSLCRQFDDDEEYKDLFKYYALHYEVIIMRKKPRNKKN